jgi:hypothetical protein
MKFAHSDPGFMLEIRDFGASCCSYGWWVLKHENIMKETVPITA